jgi:hypothetical protein
MQRSTRMLCDVVNGDGETLENQDRHVIEVEKYTNQPKDPDVSQCSSTGSSQLHNAKPPTREPSTRAYGTPAAGVMTRRCARFAPRAASVEHTLQSGADSVSHLSATVSSIGLL